MYELFTDRARKVMQLANQEAQRFNHEYLGDEHLLLGVAKEGSGVGANVLKNLDVDLRRIRLEVEKAVTSGKEMVTMGKLPQTTTAKKVIQGTLKIARELNHNYCGTEHILLGLLSVEGTARNVLTKLNVTLEKAQEQTLRLIGREWSDSRIAGTRISKVQRHWYEREAFAQRASVPSLVEQANSGLLSPSRGPWEVQRLINVLNRNWRNNALLVGKPGVGKRSLVEKLAAEIAYGNGTIIDACGDDIIQVSIRAAYIKERFTVACRRERILFVPDVHLLLTATQTESELFRRFVVELNRGVRCIATTTPEFEDQISGYQEVMAHFQRIELSPPSAKQTVEIVKSRADEYKHVHRVQPTGEAIQKAYDLAEQHGDILYPRHAQPALTLDVIEHAAAFAGWQNANKDSANANDDVSDLHAYDIEHSVAMRLGKEIELR